jgi:uncharacterized protein
MIDPIQIIEQYYPKNSDIHYILLIHSEHVRDKALAVAAQNPDLRLDTEFIAEAAMLHDIGIFMCNAPRIHCNGTHQYIEHGYLGAELLRKNCSTARHAFVCERHTGVGISKKMIIENNLPLPQRDMLPITFEEQLICYADKFYSKSQLKETLSIERIRTQLGHFGQSQVAKFDAWHDLFEH